MSNLSDQQTASQRNFMIYMYIRQELFGTWVEHNILEQKFLRENCPKTMFYRSTYIYIYLFVYKYVRTHTYISRNNFSLKTADGMKGIQYLVK